MIGGNQSWKQTFTFDRYGNRRFDFSNGNTTVPDPNCSEPICNPTISTSNNRLTSTGWQYDSAGNTTRDGSYSTFTYDAENKQVLVKNSSSVTRGEYWYDGDGKRVKKKGYDSSGNLTEDTIFVYDATGRSIAEYSAIDPNQIEGGSAPQVAYLTNDHLGSPRINTNASGAIIARHDYHPFGEEISTSHRINHPEYAGDTVRKQFTGYERDPETDLDFARARMFANRLGRFTTVDPAMKALRADPQSWNKYTYGLNSPLRFVDRDGRWPTEIHNLIFALALPALSKREMDRIKQGSWDVDFPKTVIGRYANEHGMCKPGQGGFSCAMGVFAASQKNYGKAIDLSASDPLGSKYYFGRGSHTEHDLNSPAHEFEVYDDKNLLACLASGMSNVIACALYFKEASDHNEKEKFITQDQLQQQIAQTQQQFKNIYGDAALKDAMGIFAGARFIFDGSIDGKKLPTVDLGNLGVVTVHADGRQEWEGKLKKIE